MTNRHAMVRARDIDDPERETNLQGASLYTELTIGMPGIEKRLARFPAATTAEAIAAINRTTAGNFRLVTPLLEQAERVMKLNDGADRITTEIIDAALLSSESADLPSLFLTYTAE